MVEPVKKPILGGGRFAGLNREYSAEYSIGSAAAWMQRGVRRGLKGNILENILRRGWRLGFWLGSARLNGSNMARVDVTRLQPLERVAATGQTVQNRQAARVGYLRLRSS